MQKVKPLNLLLAIIIPPLGALLQVGFTAHFFLNILLTFLGFIPGVIHAVWLVLSNKSG
jgi:uncharacterized membrane protein YqaE (UPF0057 family)